MDTKFKDLIHGRTNFHLKLNGNRGNVLVETSVIAAMTLQFGYYLMGGQ